MPDAWPGCGFPVIAKPSEGSGSEGIRIFDDPAALKRVLGNDPASSGWVAQAFLEGPTYSVEVIRRRGRASAFQVTDLYMDAGYDCKRVTAPSGLPPADQAELRRLSAAIADALDLDGLMDVEVVRWRGAFKLLEIDARFPSQTPMAVFWSSGVNFVELLARGWGGNQDLLDVPGPGAPGGVVLEHIEAGPGVLSVAGEHLLAGAGPLRIVPDFFGADEAVTDYRPGSRRWTATLICTGDGPDAAWARRNQVVAAIRRAFGLTRYHDAEPSRSVAVEKGRKS